MYTVEEQAAHRKQWVEALRSGKYQQGERWLRYGDKFCCLGVACDISGLGRWVDVMDGDSAVSVLPYAVDAEQQMQVLPKKIMDWLGVQSSKVSIHNINRLHTLLTDCNDDGNNFNIIADIIESGDIAIND